MPAGPSILGVAYFTGVKLIGYTAAGFYLNRSGKVAQPHPLVFGATRTAIGVVAGVSYASTLGLMNINHTEIAFPVGLTPVRFLEWLVVILLFYEHVPAIATKRAGYVARGIAWSYVLDIPAMLAAFVIPGGFWVC